MGNAGSFRYHRARSPIYFTFDSYPTTPSSASLSIVLLASPVKLRRFSSTTDPGRPRPPRCSPADGGGDVRGSDAADWRFRLDMIELTPAPPPPPRKGRDPRGGRARDDDSLDPIRESDARPGLIGASSFCWETAGEGLRMLPPASGEEEFDGERTRGLLVRMPGRGEPLLRRTGIGGALTGAAAGAGAGAAAGTGSAAGGAGEPRSDSGGGEAKAGRGGISSSSGGGDLKAGRAGTPGFAAGFAGTGTGATTRGGSGAGLGVSGGGGGTDWMTCGGGGGTATGAGAGTGTEAAGAASGAREIGDTGSTGG